MPRDDRMSCSSHGLALGLIKINSSTSSYLLSGNDNHGSIANAGEDIVDAGPAPEDAELADVLEEMGNPDALTVARPTTRLRHRISRRMRSSGLLVRIRRQCSFGKA